MRVKHPPVWGRVGWGGSTLPQVQAPAISNCQRRAPATHAALGTHTACPSRAHPQVALNQLCLAPITITVAFAWNLALTGQAHRLPAKLRADFVQTMLTGWKFWVPAATINFVAVPLEYQVGGHGWCGWRARRSGGVWTRLWRGTSPPC